MRKSKYLDYCDIFVSCFIDYDKCLAVFVNDKGDTRAISFDNNFYSIEDNIVAYDYLIKESLSYGGKIKDIDLQDYKKYLKRYIKHIERQMPQDDELNWDYLKMLGVDL